MTMPLPLDPTPTPRRRTAILTILPFLGLIPLIFVAWALGVALIEERATTRELEHVIAFRDCVGRVTDLIMDAYDTATPPTMMHSAKITTLCDTLTLGTR